MINVKIAYFAGGCFWCLASSFRKLKGILSITSGYAGGIEKDPTYDEVKHQRTSHRETIRIEYDENIISYTDLLNGYFENIDLFDDEGQFIDRGHSYTCAIFYLSEEEKIFANSKIHELEKKFTKKIMVELIPFSTFFKAEDYHQDFDIKHKKELEDELISSGRKSKKKTLSKR